MSESGRAAEGTGAGAEGAPAPPPGPDPLWASDLDLNGDPIPDGVGDPRPRPLLECPRCPMPGGAVEALIGSNLRARIRCVDCGYRLA